MYLSIKGGSKTGNFLIKCLLQVYVYWFLLCLAAMIMTYFSLELPYHRVIFCTSFIMFCHCVIKKKRIEKHCGVQLQIYLKLLTFFSEKK